jgi:hypothetical protein
MGQKNIYLQPICDIRIDLVDDANTISEYSSRLAGL